MLTSPLFFLAQVRAVVEEGRYVMTLHQVPGSPVIVTNAPPVGGGEVPPRAVKYGVQLLLLNAANDVLLTRAYNSKRMFEVSYMMREHLVQLWKSSDPEKGRCTRNAALDRLDRVICEATWEELNAMATLKYPPSTPHLGALDGTYPLS